MSNSCAFFKSDQNLPILDLGTKVQCWFEMKKRKMDCFATVHY